MARIRTMKPEFWTSEQVVECSTNARLLFVGMWNFADDGGAMKASTKTLKMQVFPADDFTVDDIQGMVDELKANNLIAEYTHENVHYWWVTGWHHQRIDRPSYKFPGPLNPNDTVDISTNARRTLDESSSNGSRALDYGKERKGKERKGMEGNEEADASSCAEPQSAAAPIVSIPLNDKTDFGISQQQIDEWRELYPGVDVVQELRNMRGWSTANPSKRKTRRGVLRFINGWLSREQDDAGRKSSGGNGTANPQPRKGAITRAIEALEHAEKHDQAGTGTHAGPPPGLLPGKR